MLLIPLDAIKELLDDGHLPNVLIDVVGVHLLEHHARRPRLTRPVLREFERRRQNGTI